MPNPWEMDWSQPQGDPVIARDPYKVAAEARATEDQAMEKRRVDLAEQSAARQRDKDSRDLLEWQATHNPDGTPKVKGGKSLPEGAAKRIEGGVGQYAALTGALGGFRDDYAGNAITGGLENTLQGINSDFGTEGQRNWWANFRSTDNVIRNELFGAALTPAEKSAYEATTIDPSLDAPVVRENLAKRTEILRGALDRQRRFMIANGYNQEAIDILYEPLKAMEALKNEDAAAPPPIDDENGLQINVTDDSPANPTATPPSGGGGGGGLMDGLAQGAGSIVEGIASIPALVVDPLATTLGRALGYDNYTSDFASQVRGDLGLPANQDSTSDTIIKGATGALTGSLAGRGAASLANSAPVRNALSAFGATPIRDAAAGAGAAAGGIAGQAVGGVPGQIAGTLAGGVGGYGAANALAGLAQRGPRVPNALLSAADDLGVTMLPADVGGVGTRMASGAVGRTLGGIPLAEGAERSIQSAGRARDRVAASIGDVSDNAGAGQAARRGFDSFAKSSEARAGQLYDRVSVPNDAKVQLGQTRGALAEVTRGMQSNPELSRLWANHPRLRATLEALTPTDVAPQGREAFTKASDELIDAQTNYENVRNAVSSAEQIGAARQAVEKARADVLAAKKMADTPPTGGELSWEDMKRFRSIVGEIVGQPGVAADGSDVAGLRKLYGALSSDMEVSAARAGPKALQEFRRANQYWRGRSERLDDVFSTLFGKRDQRSDEAVFGQINSWAQAKNGDFSRLARTIRSMPDDEANTVRATIIQRMGQAKAGRQDDAGEVFSPAEFGTQWASLSDRAKNVLFSNKQHRQDLDKLAMVMNGMKRAGEFQNFSNTALGTNLTAAGTALGTSAATGSVAGAIATGAVAGGTFALGKLLASPRVARLIASTSGMPAETGGRKLVDQLTVLATREPALASDLKGLQQYLTDTLGQSPVRAAAGEQEADGRRKPPQ